MSTPKWKQGAPFLFYAVIALFSGVVATMSERRSKISILGFLLAGFISWQLIEYVMHRFILHRYERLRNHSQIRQSHLVHHQQPQAMDDLFIGLRMSLPVTFCFCLLAWAVVQTWQATVYLFTGLVIGWFSYEWLHYQAHHGRARLRVMRYLKKYHLLHHYQTPHKRFGVSTPLLDFLFGTFLSVRHVSERMKN